MVLTQIDPLKGFGQFHDYTLHERTETMNDLELLARLKAHETFGISMVQRIALFGYQRAVDTLERLEAQGVIERDEATSLWRLVSSGATVHCQQRPGEAGIPEA